MFRRKRLPGWVNHFDPAWGKNVPDWGTTGSPRLVRAYYCRACKKVVWRTYSQRKVVSYCETAGKHTWIRRTRKGKKYVYFDLKEKAA